ncbi:hypothetical protein U9M48_041397 [Paspalum notatum var. saurae]|uniref:Uncharacterized protein n=1 Tax=Paspalum notatum var. saurae TaxID=547442 RepID=A0AAQ3UQG3_PASNO
MGDDDMLLHQFQCQSLLVPCSPPPDADAVAGSNSHPNYCFFLGVCVSLLTKSPAMLLLAAAAASCAMMIFIKGRRRRRRRSNNQHQQVLINLPPGRGRGSSSWWSWSVSAVVETLSFLAANSSGRGFYHFVEARHRRYGPPGFRTALFGHTHVFVSSADAARLLLASEPRGFSKRYVRTVADLLGEHSLLCASHDAHRALRRAIAPLFNARATASLAASFDALTRRLIARDWRSSGSGAVVVLDAALGITFDAICDMLIATLQPDAKRQLQSDVMAVTQAMLAVPLRLPGTRFYAGLQARRRIMDEEESAAARRLPAELLLLLLTDEEDDQLILDNILTLIIAGQVTTATAITWMVKYLADNRGFQETLRSVQLELAPAAKHQDDAPLTLQHLNSMELAYMAVKESLRMASIVSWFPRVALEDCQVAGFHIKKGWIVNVDARSLHYDPTVYDNPTTFDPSRFKHGEDTKPYSFLVFGAGGRTCLGMNLAKIMMLIFLHRLVTTFRWEMADENPSLEKWAMFPRLKNGCPIHITPI